MINCAAERSICRLLREQHEKQKRSVVISADLLTRVVLRGAASILCCGCIVKLMNDRTNPQERAQQQQGKSNNICQCAHDVTECAVPEGTACLNADDRTRNPILTSSNDKAHAT